MPYMRQLGFQVGAICTRKALWASLLIFLCCVPLPLRRPPHTHAQLLSTDPACREWTTDATPVHLTAIHGSGPRVRHQFGIWRCCRYATVGVPCWLAAAGLCAAEPACQHCAPPRQARPPPGLPAPPPCPTHPTSPSHPAEAHSCCPGIYRRAALRSPRCQVLPAVRTHSTRVVRSGAARRQRWRRDAAAGCRHGLSRPDRQVGRGCAAPGSASCPAVLPAIHREAVPAAGVTTWWSQKLELPPCQSLPECTLQSAGCA